jgi:truncated hemoglobin YjbI
MVAHIEGERLRVFEHRVLRRIFGFRRDELTGLWIKHIEELTDLYSSPRIVRVIKSRSMRRAGHVARMGDKRSLYWVFGGDP